MSVSAKLSVYPKPLLRVQICSLYASYMCCIWVCECGYFMFNCEHGQTFFYPLSYPLIIVWVAVWKPVSCGVLHLENNFILLFPPVLHAMFWSLLPESSVTYIFYSPFRPFIFLSILFAAVFSFQQRHIAFDLSALKDPYSAYDFVWWKTPLTWSP